MMNLRNARTRKGKSVRETFLRKFCYLHVIPWYDVEVSRMISRGQITEAQCKHLFPKTRRGKEIEDWRKRQLKKELKQVYSQEHIDYLVSIGYLKEEEKDDKTI